MELGSLLFLLLLLVCPLAMLFVHRGGHGAHGSHGGGRSHAHGAAEEPLGSLDDLRRRRAELDAEIERLEDAEAETTPAPAEQSRS